MTAAAQRGIWPLLSLNFFMADMQAGIGPFLGVFLLAHGWQSGLIGTVMTVGGVAGMLMTDARGRADRCDDAQASSTSSFPASARCWPPRSDSAFADFWAGDGCRRSRPRSPARRSGPPSPASRSAWFTRPASIGRTATTRRSTMPATWSAPGCRACSDGSSASPPCSGWRRCSAFSRSSRC